METNHKELFDQVIEETKDTEFSMDGSMDDKVNNGCIPIHSCTGAIYFVDPHDPGNSDLFAPDNLMKNISGFSEMETSLINVMHNLLRINEFPDDEREDYICHLIEQFTQSLNAYGIKPTYDEINTTMSMYTKAMFMAFDLFSFAKTLNHFLVSMVQANMLSGVPTEKANGFTDDNVFDDGEVDLPTSTAEKYEGNRCFKVYGHIQSDNSVEILQVIEEDTDPSEMLIVHDEDNDELDCVISVHTIAKTEQEAVRDAKIVFQGYIRDMLETETDKAYRVAEEMNAESGLLG